MDSIFYFCAFLGEDDLGREATLLFYARRDCWDKTPSELQALLETEPDFVYNGALQW